MHFSYEFDSNILLQESRFILNYSHYFQLLKDNKHYIVSFKLAIIFDYSILYFFHSFYLHSKNQNINITPITQDSIIQDLQNLSQSLSSLLCHLTELTLKYCFLTSEHINVLAQGLSNNQSLIYLNLQHNGFNDLSGKYLANMIQWIILDLLIQLLKIKTIFQFQMIRYLEHNQLGNDFIQLLSVALKRNNILNLLKLCYNSISEIKPLLNVIGPENTSIQDLGNIQYNPLLLAQVEQLQNRLKESKESTTNYQILKPINFTQILHKNKRIIEYGMFE